MIYVMIIKLFSIRQYQTLKAKKSDFTTSLEKNGTDSSERWLLNIKRRSFAG